MTQTMCHKPVLLDEVVAYLNIDPDGVYVDGTYGRGGHAREILSKLGPKGRLLCLDQDPEAILDARQIRDPRVCVAHASFSDLADILTQYQLGPASGILFDLGVSSPQLDEAARGFSFMREGPLDMRMDPTRGVPLSDWLARAEVSEIRSVLKTYGQERFPGRIASSIVQAREASPLTTTTELVEIIKKAVPYCDPHKHPATRSFQAFRIYINEELTALSKGMQEALLSLKPSGRLCVLCFHSLEVRSVKRFFRAQAYATDIPKDLPLRDSEIPRRLRIVGKGISPSVQEIEDNPRARSARLWVGEKLECSCDFNDI